MEYSVRVCDFLLLHNFGCCCCPQMFVFIQNFILVFFLCSKNINKSTWFVCVCVYVQCALSLLWSAGVYCIYWMHDSTRAFGRIQTPMRAHVHCMCVLWCEYYAYKRVESIWLYIILLYVFKLQHYLLSAAQSMSANSFSVYYKMLFIYKLHCYIYIHTIHTNNTCTGLRWLGLVHTYVRTTMLSGWFGVWLFDCLHLAVSVFFFCG